MAEKKLSREKLLAAFLDVGLSTRQSEMLADHIRSADVFEVAKERSPILKNIKEVVKEE